MWAILVAQAHHPDGGAGAAEVAEAPAKANLPGGLVAPIAARLADVLVINGGNSLPLSEAILQASSNENLTRYRQLRAEHSKTARGQRDLAMWCRKHELLEEETLHWWTLLSMAPDHSEAIRALRLKEHRGMLLTNEEVERTKREQKDVKLAGKKWLPRLKKLRQQIENGDDEARAAALRQLLAINDPLALPSIEEVFLTAPSDLATAVVETVARMEGDKAAEVLARVAIDSDDEYVREQAATALQSRSHHSYVPVLLARLGTPIELSVSVTVEPGAPITDSYTAYSYTGRSSPIFYNKHRLSGNYVSSDVAAWGLEVQRSSGVAVIGYEPQRIQYNYVLTRESDDPDNPHEYSGTIDGSHNPRRSSRVSSIEELKEQICEANEVTVALNKLIHAALVKATRIEIKQPGLQQAPGEAEVDPRGWWNWWKTHTQSRHYFGRGIEIWTQTGLSPIEQILVGDRVLTRDSKTGALAFNLVLAVDAQAESVMQVIEVDSREIVATLDQPFFVFNVGWRKAGDLQAGMMLDGLSGPKQITQIAAGDAVSCYSLLVANVPNYFVEQGAILAYDATVASEFPIVDK